MPNYPHYHPQRSGTKTIEQRVAFLLALFEGLHKEGFTGVIKLHIHEGGVRSARKEEAIDLDW